jgi:predicted nucleic acid-binding protein
MFWDSSALVPLLLPETRSRALVDLFAGDREVAIWWATPLECQSAIFRRHRERPLDSAQLNAARDRLRAIVDHVDVVAPSDDVRRGAGRLVGVHSLRAADALQLAAALLWSEDHPQSEMLITLDPRLGDAAAREGFTVASI